MRVIGGEYRSRRLVAPRGMATRPTSDRLRETMFNVLGPRLAGARFADLYAGSGAVGIEALSRGAASCLFVERAPAAISAIRANLEALGIREGARIESRPVARVLEDLIKQAQSFDLVFLDPPYEAAGEYTASLGRLGEAGANVLAQGGTLVAEHARRSTLPERFGVLVRTRLLEQGDAGLSFYATEESAQP